MNLSVSITIIFTIYFVLLLMLKPDKTKVYCGLFAFSGPKNMSPDLWYSVLANLKILGLYNDSRGGDNFGILLDQSVYKSTELYKAEAKHFIEKNGNLFQVPVLSSVVIGHCRKASVGGKDIKNGHPFEIYRDSKDADPYLIGAHNGTISNWKALANKHKITTNFSTVDSEIFYNILAAEPENDWSLFGEYEGVGAFLWHYPNKPDQLYVFKGASKTWSISPVTDERPLYWYRCPITKGIYFSSIEESLFAICMDKKDVKNLEPNKVYCVKYGKLLGEAIEIDRTTKNQKEFDDVDYTGEYFGQGYSAISSSKRFQNEHKNTAGYKYNNVDRKSNKVNNAHPEHLSYLDDLASYPENKLKGDLLYQKHFLVWRNGHPMDGIVSVDTVTNKILNHCFAKNITEFNEFRNRNGVPFDTLITDKVRICLFVKGLSAKGYFDYVRLQQIFKDYIPVKQKTAATNVFHYIGKVSGRCLEVSRIVSNPIPYYWSSDNTFSKSFMINGGSGVSSLIVMPFAFGKNYRFLDGWLVEIGSLDNKIDNDTMKSNIKRIIETTKAENPVSKAILIYDKNAEDASDDDDSPIDNSPAIVNKTIKSEESTLIDDFAKLQEDKMEIFETFEIDFLRNFNFLLQKFKNLEQFAETSLTVPEWRQYFSWYFRDKIMNNAFPYLENDCKDKYKVSELNETMFVELKTNEPLIM